MALNANPLDVVLRIEMTANPLEAVLKETKPGTPEEIRAYLEGLDSREGFFVYSASGDFILTTEEYLAKEPA